MKGFPLETGCLAPSARTETEKLSKAKTGYAKEGVEGAVWGAQAGPGAERRLMNLGHLTTMRAWEDTGKDGLPLLYLSFCREKRILFYGAETAKKPFLVIVSRRAWDQC